ncbi:hypothetical protein [Paraburkholderia sp. J63]|uniref:hypothetical protein n=1 Tax=Paraburkholderia sp. J63 TaxID=2805434 RepID=UPI002ABE1D28|nr:hypothetical protein [Paraburkholderia sp. J63]
MAKAVAGGASDASASLPVLGGVLDTHGEIARIGCASDALRGGTVRRSRALKAPAPKGFPAISGKWRNRPQRLARRAKSAPSRSGFRVIFLLERQFHLGEAIVC